MIDFIVCKQIRELFSRHGQTERRIQALQNIADELRRMNSAKTEIFTRRFPIPRNFSLTNHRKGCIIFYVVKGFALRQ